MTQTSDSHDYFRLLAAASIDGEVTASEMTELRTHLATCPSCRADERAMRSDNAWLASVEAVRPPRPDVRTAVMRAAEGKAAPTGRVARVSLGFASIALVVGAFWWLSFNPYLGPGASPSASARPTAVEGSSQPTAGPTIPLAPNLWSIPPDMPFARVDARFIGNSTGAAPEILVSAIVIGGNKGAPQGYVNFLDPTGESWLGSITRASYGYDQTEQWSIAFVEGCKGGGVAPCDLYALQFIEHRVDHQDEISLSFITARRPQPDPWEFWYLRVTGELVVDGLIAGPEPTPSPPPTG